jgi:hypothetical protein
VSSTDALALRTADGGLPWPGAELVPGVTSVSRNGWRPGLGTGPSEAIGIPRLIHGIVNVLDPPVAARRIVSSAESGKSPA